MQVLLTFGKMFFKFTTNVLVKDLGLLFGGFFIRNLSVLLHIKTKTFSYNLFVE